MNTRREFKESKLCRSCGFDDGGSAGIRRQWFQKSQQKKTQQEKTQQKETQQKNITADIIAGGGRRRTEEPATASSLYDKQAPSAPVLL